MCKRPTSLTGETRKYNPASASYGGIVPAIRSR